MTRGRPKIEENKKAVFKKISVYEHTFNDIQKMAKKQKKAVCILVEDIVNSKK